MAQVIPFQPRVTLAAAPPVFDPHRYRARIEAAAHSCLDLAHRLVDLLDRFDGDPDFEPDTDAEDGGCAEPMLAALVGAVSQIRWTGFEGDAA